MAEITPADQQPLNRDQLQSLSLDELLEVADNRGVTAEEGMSKSQLIDRLLQGAAASQAADLAQQQAAVAANQQLRQAVAEGADPAADSAQSAPEAAPAPPEVPAPPAATAPEGVAVDQAKQERGALAAIASALGNLDRAGLDRLAGAIDRARGQKGAEPQQAAGPSDAATAYTMPIDRVHSGKLTRGDVLKILTDAGHKVSEDLVTPGSAVIRRAVGFVDHQHDGQAYLSTALADGRKIVVRIEGLAEEEYDKAKAVADAAAHAAVAAVAQRL